MSFKPLPLTCAVLAIALGSAAPSHAALLKYEFEINKLTQGTRTIFTDRIAGSFLLDDSTPVNFPSANAVEQFGFMFDAPEALGLNINDFRLSGSILRGEAALTLTNSIPGQSMNTLFMEINRAQGFLQGVVLRVPGEFAVNLVGVEEGLNTFTVSEVVAPVPLPAAGWMMLAGLLGLFGLRRRSAA